MTYCFSTDMQEEEIIFGGEKKLAAAIQEAYDLFHPKAIAIFATCPVGLIGDDVHAVAREMKEKLGDQRLRLQLRGLQGRQPVGRPPHRQQPGLQARDRARRDGQGRQVQDQPAGRIQHRRRRLRDRRICSRRAGSPLVATFSGNSTLRPVRQRPHGRPELRHVPPLDQLRGRDDGEEVRHPLDQGQLHRRRGARPSRCARSPSTSTTRN